ncbi:hypothetical protein MTBSS4_170040 [Magnetospirillum sp. SS-4]|nr:hypothetical protein MTBSS4_170040 [Magnetospirillum sp. SS-4]
MHLHITKDQRYIYFHQILLK